MTIQTELRREERLTRQDGAGPGARDVEREPCRILFVPGFVCDTYSEIERQYVELCAAARKDVRYLWLVPDIRCRGNRFARPALREKLAEPVWVPRLREHGVPYVVGNISRYNVVRNYRLFRDVFRRHRIDAVYTHFGYERFWAAFFGRLWGKVTIWNEHWHSLGTRFVRFKRLFYGAFVDDFLAVSGFIGRTLPAGAAVHVFKNAVHPEEKRAASPEEAARMRGALGIPPGAKVVLMVSAFRPNKRYDLAMRVCREVLNRREDVAFVFLGEGAMRPWVLEEARRCGLGSRIAAPGHVDDVDRYYALADVCMLTSTGEPCALAIFEAMKHGRPLVAFHSGGTPEIVRDGATGILVPEEDVHRFAEEVLGLLTDGRRRSEIGAAARESVRSEFNRAKWIGDLNRLLRNIVERRRNGRASIAAPPDRRSRVLRE
ncbi:glycosyl transferase family 1 [Sulfurifustis variabilis]|uniref:Glycosyl transferase family 1 n=1 Tax=Sulfurifustis variabilis TaxID=1675686 RepID=A0A1B4V9E5_9GAMM|nr:glycosyltransferase family 4 protein [Sulfurifustis variabilis]BAU48104.1 glycosyl transferase family 1 [Sulfurifustis variabilis]